MKLSKLFRQKCRTKYFYKSINLVLCLPFSLFLFEKLIFLITTKPGNFSSYSKSKIFQNLVIPKCAHNLLQGTFFYFHVEVLESAHKLHIHKYFCSPDRLHTLRQVYIYMNIFFVWIGVCFCVHLFAFNYRTNARSIYFYYM